MIFKTILQQPGPKICLISLYMLQMKSVILIHGTWLKCFIWKIKYVDNLACF